MSWIFSDKNIFNSNITVIKICCVWLNNDINKQLLFKHTGKMEAYFIWSHMKVPSFTLILLRTHRPFWRFTTTCSFSKSVTATPPQSLSMLKSAIKTNKQLFIFHIWIIQKQNNSIKGRKEGNVLFNDALNTFYLRLYGIGYMVKDHSDSETGNPLLPHGLLFLINNKGSFICTIPQTG